MKTTAEYKRDERKRKKELGLIRIDIWTKQEFAPQVRRFNQSLIDSKKDAEK